MPPTSQEVAALGEPLSDAAISKVTDIMRGLLGDFGKDQAEKYEEQQRRINEAVAAVTAGRPQDAAPADADNELVGQRNYVQEFTQAIHGLTTSREQAAAAANEGPFDAKAKVRALSRAAYYLIQADGRSDRACEIARKCDDETDETVAFMARSLQAFDYSSGGAMVDGEMSTEVIPELLSDTAVAGDLAMTAVPLRGQYVLPYVETGPSGGHYEEVASVNASNIAFNQRVLVEKQATIIVAVSRDLVRLRGSSERVINQAIEDRLRDTVDLAMIRSLGVSSEPIGLRYKAVSANRLNVNTVVSVDNTIEDLLRIQYAATDQKVPHNDSGRWGLAPRTVRYLQQLRSNGSEYQFARDIAMGQLLGSKIAGAGRGIQNIPINLAVTDTDESEILHWYASHLVMGIAENFSMRMSDDAGYLDSSGNQQNAFTNGEVVIRLDFKYDFADRHGGKSIGVAVDVDWT